MRGRSSARVSMHAWKNCMVYVSRLDVYVYVRSCRCSCSSLLVVHILLDRMHCLCDTVCPACMASISIWRPPVKDSRKFATIIVGVGIFIFVPSRAFLIQWPAIVFIE